MYQESEIVDLLMVLFLTPIMVVSVRAITMPGKRWFVAAYIAITIGYVFTVVEGYVLPDLFNLLEHITHAIAGLCYMVAAVALLRASLAAQAPRASDTRRSST